MSRHRFASGFRFQGWRTVLVGLFWGWFSMSWVWLMIVSWKSICSCILVEWQEFIGVEGRFWCLSFRHLEKVRIKHIFSPSLGKEWFTLVGFLFRSSVEGPKYSGKGESCGLFDRTECRAMPEEGWQMGVGEWVCRGSYGEGKTLKRMSHTFLQKVNYGFLSLVFAQVEFMAGLICAFW